MSAMSEQATTIDQLIAELAPADLIGLTERLALQAGCTLLPIGDPSTGAGVSDSLLELAKFRADLERAALPTTGEVFTACGPTARAFADAIEAVCTELNAETVRRLTFYHQVRVALDLSSVPMVSELPAAAADLHADWIHQRELVTRLKAEQLRPGVMRCAKCEFRLIRQVLYAQDGAVGAGSSETEPCPNGCGPLWPVTWKEECQAADLRQRLQAAEERAEKVREIVAAEIKTLQDAGNGLFVLKTERGDYGLFDDIADRLSAALKTGA